MNTLIAANWKLYLNNQETLRLAENIVQAEWNIPTDVDVVICPSYPMLASMHALHEHNIALGAQDVFWKNEGAFTGEVGPAQLRDLSVEYAIIGHSERRQQLGETSEIINKKIKGALAGDLIPILCVGEDYEVHESGMTQDKISKQLHAALKDVDLVKGRLIVAYEPVWAIYPSKYEVNPDDVAAVAQGIEKELKTIFGESVYADRCQIIYGGSVSASNIKIFLTIPRINGALIGHASTTPEEFGKIIRVSSQITN